MPNIWELDDGSSIELTGFADGAASAGLLGQISLRYNRPRDNQYDILQYMVIECVTFAIANDEPVIPIGAHLAVTPLAVKQPQSFTEELTTLINRYSLENASDTPDFLLAEYINMALEVYNTIVVKREKWYGRETGNGRSIMAREPESIRESTTDKLTPSEPVFPADKSPYLLAMVYDNYTSQFQRMEFERLQKDDLFFLVDNDGRSCSGMYRAKHSAISGEIKAQAQSLVSQDRTIMQNIREIPE